MKSYRVIGLMSGTSLDGLDMAYCCFHEKQGRWQYSIEQAQTIEFDAEMKQRLEQAVQLSGLDLWKLHTDFGVWMGEQVADFMKKNHISADFIASHGHTVFHQPHKRLNLQIGQPLAIRQRTGLPVVADFRTPNILAGGQGAPLVPIGDKLLFAEYDYCINIGGFANISYDDDHGNRVAFDVAPANLIFNRLAQQFGCYFDKNGMIGTQGRVDATLLNRLNQLEYYAEKFPKSLGVEWLEQAFLPLFQKSTLLIPDKLRTAYEHLIVQLMRVLKPQKKVLLTGGGVLNISLVYWLTANYDGQFIVPDKQLIDFKEALIFAFLGVLKMENQPNCLASYTGAPSDMVCGTVY